MSMSAYEVVRRAVEFAGPTGCRCGSARWG
jgi:hypothetical protein